MSSKREQLENSNSQSQNQKISNSFGRNLSRKLMNGADKPNDDEMLTILDRDSKLGELGAGGARGKLINCLA